MKLALFILLGLLGVILIIILSVNHHFDKRLEAPQFASGKFPDPAPSGPYKGNHFDGVGKNWLGKHFFADKNEGTNYFKNGSKVERRYPFKTSRQKGLRNKDQQVLLLNYDYKDNPLWLKFIRDEVVQVGEGRYLGKIHVKLGPIVVTIGYFRLNQQ